MTIQKRRDTAANWTSNNPTLAAGEDGWESDTGRMKTGDGTTAWNSLAYVDATWAAIAQAVTNKDLSDASNTYRAASTTATGAVELATAAETTAGTDTARAVTPDGLAASIFGTETVVVEAFSFSEAESVATGDGAAYFLVPSNLNGMNLVGVFASHLTAGTGAGADTTDIQIHNVTDTADMLSTAITIDEDEVNSSTAAAAAVINTASDDVATGDILRIDVDDLVTGTAPVGLQVIMEFRLP